VEKLTMRRHPGQTEATGGWADSRCVGQLGQLLAGVGAPRVEIWQSGGWPRRPVRRGWGGVGLVAGAGQPPARRGRGGGRRPPTAGVGWWGPGAADGREPEGRRPSRRARVGREGRRRDGCGLTVESAHIGRDDEWAKFSWAAQSTKNILGQILG